MLQNGASAAGVYPATVPGYGGGGPAPGGTAAAAALRLDECRGRGGMHQLLSHAAASEVTSDAAGAAALYPGPAPAEVALPAAAATVTPCALAAATADNEQRLAAMQLHRQVRSHRQLNNVPRDSLHASSEHIRFRPHSVASRLGGDKRRV